MQSTETSALIRIELHDKKMTEWIKKGNHSYGVYWLHDGTSVLNQTELHDKEEDLMDKERKSFLWSLLVG